jgi:predicted phage terminase large subunit-like protein
MATQPASQPDPLDWRQWPEDKKRLLRARLLERRQRPWRETARPEQLPPLGEWYIWFLTGGRGAGKTRSGAEWLAEELRGDGPGDESAILAPTFGDARDRCVEGPSGLLRAMGTSRAEVESGRSWTVERWNRSMGELRLRSGAVVHIDGADDGALRIQGGNLRRAWCDELRLWKQAEQAWDESLLPAVRLGNPHIVVTSTPKPTRLVRRLLKDDTVIKSHMTTFANEANLAPVFLDQMRSRYGGTRLGQQELMGRLLEDVEGALWRMEWIDAHRMDADAGPVEYRAKTVALDPSDGTSDGDEQGLCLAGLGLDNDFYVIMSEGYRESQVEWITRALKLCQKHNAKLVWERNHGGAPLRELIQMVMGQTGIHAPTREVWASTGKRTRAEPVAALYEGGAVRTKGRVRHLGEFVELEEQMTTFTGAPGEKSPDRLDAAVFALTDLMNYGAPPGFGENPGEVANGVVRYGDASPGVVRWE